MQLSIVTIYFATDQLEFSVQVIPTCENTAFSCNHWANVKIYIRYQIAI